MSPHARDEYFLDPRVVRRAFDRASGTFDRFAGVHAEIRARLLERLDLVRIQPSVVLDLGAGTGRATRALQDRYRSALVVAVDISVPMLQQARRQQRLLNRFSRLAADAQQLPVRSASVDLLFSNLMLQWCPEPDRVFTEAARALKPNGLFTFTALGPDTLQELRRAWAAVDPGVHVHRFIDMHDIGDALMRAGFAEPVMDTERLTITYPDFEALLRELRLTGSTNLAHGRRRGLRGAASARQVRDHYESLRAQSLLPATIEVVYGHAWGAVARPARSTPTEFAIPIGKIGRRE